MSTDLEIIKKLEKKHKIKCKEVTIKLKLMIAGYQTDDDKNIDIG